MNKPLVSIIIVNYNGAKYLKKCLNSIAEQTYKNYEVILVDNNSTDNSLGIIKNYTFVKVIKLNKNYWFAKANNIGFCLSHGEYILLLNNDAYFGEKNSLEKMINEMEKMPDCGVMQPKIILTDNRGLDACGAFLTTLGVLYHNGLYKNPDESRYNTPFSVYSVLGACMLTRRMVTKKVGLFVDDYVAYMEETDFCHRCWLAGYKVIFNPCTFVYHIKGGSLNKELYPIALFHGTKNYIQTFIVNLNRKALLLILFPFITLNIFLALYYLLTNRVKLTSAILNGIYWNIKNIKILMSRRKYVQRKMRVIDDKMLMRVIKVKVTREKVNQLLWFLKI